MKHVFLDLDQLLWDWLAVIVSHPTGVIYHQQCGGSACWQRKLEGYLVPVAGVRFRGQDGRQTTAAFTAIFHERDRCCWSWHGADLPEDRYQQLRILVEDVPFWIAAKTATGSARDRLLIDESRRLEVAEAWVPVISPYGPGVLVWDNCD